MQIGGGDSNAHMNNTPESTVLDAGVAPQKAILCLVVIRSCFKLPNHYCNSA